MAPAVISRERPKPPAAPIRAIPTVPATVHELPILRAISEQMSALAT